MISRECVLTEANAIEDWTAGGLHSPTDPGVNTPAECGLILVVKDGEFTRLYPEIGGEDDDRDGFPRSQEVLCVGDGAERYRDEINEGYRCEITGPTFPSVATLVMLAHARALREDWVRPDAIEPVYLRAPDAQINWAVREGRP